MAVSPPHTSFISTLSCHPFICDHTSFVLVLFIPSSPSPSIRLYMLLCLHPPARATLFALLVLGKLPVSSVPALVCKTPTFLHLLSSSPFSHVCQGPGGSTLCTGQWPKRECLRNCQLSPIIRGSP